MRPEEQDITVNKTDFVAATKHRHIQNFEQVRQLQPCFS
jgi:hypothetical protein